METKLTDQMSKDVLTVYWNDKLEKAYIKMRNNRIRHLPVLGSDGTLVGIISDRDFQRAMNPDVREYYSADMPDVDFDPSYRICDFMSTPVQTVPYDEDLKTVTRRMINEKISALVVVKEDVCVGIVTTEDLMRVLERLLTEPRLEPAKLKLPRFDSPIGQFVELFRGITSPNEVGSVAKR